MPQSTAVGVAEQGRESTTSPTLVGSVKPQSIILAFAGHTGSGKSTISPNFARNVNWPYTSFTDYLCLEAQRRGLDHSKQEILQLLGDLLVSQDSERFCHAVLEEVKHWKPGESLVINSIHHLQIWDYLKRAVAPSVCRLVFIDTAPQQRRQKLRQEGVTDEERLRRIEAAPTEKEIEPGLKQVADIILDGTEPLQTLIEKIKDKLALENDSLNSASNSAENLHIESDKQYSYEHRQWRSLVRVIDVNGVGDQRSLDVIIPSWHPQRPISLAISCLPHELWDKLIPGLRLMAMVNLGATESDKLRLANFELASEPVLEDDLA